MTFAEIELEYERLRISYINEVIDYEEFMDYLDDVLQATDEYGVLWKKDINGNWLFLNKESNEWFIGERKKEINEEDYTVSFEAPEAPVIPKEVLEEKKPTSIQVEVEQKESSKNIKEFEDNKVSENKKIEKNIKEYKDNECKSTEISDTIKFCTACGEKIEINQKFCTNCGKRI